MTPPRTDYLNMARTLKGVDLVHASARGIYYLHRQKDHYARLDDCEKQYWYQRAQRCLRRYGIAAPNM